MEVGNKVSGLWAVRQRSSSLGWAIKDVGFLSVAMAGLGKGKEPCEQREELIKNEHLVGTRHCPLLYLEPWD